jgi:hypothetical protein
MTESLQSVEDCLKRAVAIKDSAKALLATGDEWHAVCYFYAAYHTVKAALIEDDVFDDARRLVSISPNLAISDRFAKSHQGYLGQSGRGRKLGVNDIVKLIYPQIAIEYVRLHMASVDVRYGHGLKIITSNFAVEDYTHIIEAYQAGALRA